MDRMVSLSAAFLFASKGAEEMEEKVMVSFELPRALDDRLRLVAAQRRVSRSAVIRHALETALHIPDGYTLGDGAGRPVVFDAGQQGGSDANS